MALRSEPSDANPRLRQLLEIENDEAILAPICPVTGIPVWTVVRNQFFRLIMSDLLYSSQPLLSIGTRMPRSRITKAALHSVVHNVMNRPKPAQILVRATGVGLIERQGLSFNRYTDYFIEAAPGGGWSFEDLASWTWPSQPRVARVNYTTATFSLIRMRTQFATNALHRELASKIIDRALERSETLTGWTVSSNRRAWLIAHAARRTAALPFQRATMLDWLARVRPALFLAEEGCYGQMAAFNAAAREKGVTVAEFQHGAVTGGHDVYNVAPALRESAAFRRGLPDVFLSYGSWWSDQFNLPVEKWVVGNPHRETIMKTVRPTPAARRRVLVLGDGRELNAHLDLCRAIAALLSANDWEIAFRPHPEERQHVLAMDPETFAGVSLDRESDIYVSLASTEAVVAELSTGLFDAINLSRRVFVWDTAKSRFGLPSHPFASFTNAAMLADALSQPDTGTLSLEQGESIWASGWRDRFLEFLATHGDGRQ